MSRPISEGRYVDLAGRSALVTGGAAGIGRAIAEALVRQGARVAILDCDAERIAETTQASPDIAGEVVDLRDVLATRTAVSRLEDRFGHFTLLVNNAGHDERYAFADVTPEFWDDRMAVNLRHVMFVSQAVAPGMIAAGGGSIVNLGSTSWMKGATGLIGYATAKAAILGFTKALARELGSGDVRVNCLTPGWVMTQRQLERWATPERLEAALHDQAIKHRIEPDDIAAAALFLLSDAARSITGQALVVDAGAPGS